jgi:elongation factor 1-alpha
LREEAEKVGKSSFAFAFYMDTQKEERERGVTIACQTKEFYTPKYHYTIIDAPGHKDFIKNMITGASQADVAVVMVPADGNFITSVAKGNHKEGIVQGQTRQHALLLKLLGIKQLIVCVNKMDEKQAGYKEERFTEIKTEMQRMLKQVGWTKTEVEKEIPVIPISGWKGDNLLKPTENMGWWKGHPVVVNKQKLLIMTLHDALNEMVQIPERPTDAPFRLPVSHNLKIKGVGNVICGRIEQGILKPGQEVKFMPTHTANLPCTGKVFTIEMHHKNYEQAIPGDNIGINMKALNKDNMPKKGDIMVFKDDDSIVQAKKITAMVQTLSLPGPVKVGYSPTCYIRTSHSAMRIAEIVRVRSKQTAGQWSTDVKELTSNCAAEVVLEPQQPISCDTFDSCPNLARIAMLEGHTCCAIGKITKIE